MPGNVIQLAAKVLLGIGAVLVLLGVVLLLISRWSSDGRLLPGDIVINRPGFPFYFPLVTCLVISVVFTGLLAIIGLGCCAGSADWLGGLTMKRRRGVSGKRC